MIKPKKKVCTGRNKAISYKGCQELKYPFKYNLCQSCYRKWLYETKEGNEQIKNLSIQAKKEVRIKKKNKLKAEKEALMTRSEWMNIAQKVFNTWIRMSKENVCISCDTDLSNRKYDASHYRSVGANPALRFTEDNVWNGCVRCNRDLHGNLIEYRKRLVKKIGVEKVEELEKEPPPLKISIPEIKELIVLYRQKTRELKKNS